MRADMAKVIVERPRLGGGVRRPKGCRKREVLAWRDELPAHEGIRRRWDRASYQKHFNEHLSPLRRFLQSQVGRPWNKVHSEIASHLRVDSAVQSHVLDHLRDYVAIHVLVIDGELYHGNGWHTGRLLQSLFYVCPRTGLLRENKSRWRRPRRQPPPVEYVTLDERRQLRQIGGIWYEVELAPIVPNSANCRDVVLRILVSQFSRGEARQTYGSESYAVRKRQLNKREARRAAELLAQAHRRQRRN